MGQKELEKFYPLAKVGFEAYWKQLIGPETSPSTPFDQMPEEYKLSLSAFVKAVVESDLYIKVNQ